MIEEDGIIVEKTVIEKNDQINQPVTAEKTETKTVIEKTMVEKAFQENRKARKLVYYTLGVLEALLICRFILRILGANTANLFVKIIYAITNVFLLPFSGIFSSSVTTGLETSSVMEPGTIIAMIVYALIAWGIVELIKILKARHNTGDSESL